MGKAYNEALVRWNKSPKKWDAQKLYTEWWKVAKRGGEEPEGDVDAMLLDRALDLVEGTFSILMDSTDYDETMRAIEIMEELNGDQEEGNSNLIAGMVEAS